MIDEAAEAFFFQSVYNDVATPLLVCFYESCAILVVEKLKRIAVQKCSFKMIVICRFLKLQCGY